MQDVEDFAAQNGLSRIVSELKRGALVAQDPLRAYSLEELDDDDRRTLEEEVNNKWKQPKALYFTIILNSIAAAIQGWDQTGKRNM